MCQRCDVKADHLFLFIPVAAGKQSKITKTCIIYKVFNNNIFTSHLIKNFCWGIFHGEVPDNIIYLHFKICFQFCLYLSKLIPASGNQNKIISLRCMNTGKLKAYAPEAPVIKAVLLIKYFS